MCAVITRTPLTFNITYNPTTGGYSRNPIWTAPAGQPSAAYTPIQFDDYPDVANSSDCTIPMWSTCSRNITGGAAICDSGEVCQSWP